MSCHVMSCFTKLMSHDGWLVSVRVLSVYLLGDGRLNTQCTVDLHTYILIDCGCVVRGTRWF